MECLATSIIVNSWIHLKVETKFNIISTYKFKYYPNLKNMRLIGYDEESFGNANHDGAYSKSINFLTKKMIGH